MSVDMLLQEATAVSAAATEVIDLHQVRREQELRERMCDPLIERQRDASVEMLRQFKGTDIVAHGLRRKDQAPAVQVRPAAPQFYEKLRADFIGPVDLY